MRSGAAVFLNEGAGSARTDRVRRAVDLARRALDADLHVIATRDVEEITAWLTERIDDYGTAVIAGGDGSLGVAYNVAAGREGLTLGYVPAGFGNATRHLLRLPSAAEEHRRCPRARATLARSISSRSAGAWRSSPAPAGTRWWRDATPKRGARRLPGLGLRGGALDP